VGIILHVIYRLLLDNGDRTDGSIGIPNGFTEAMDQRLFLSIYVRDLK
jgi:hypothetical protein